MKKLNLSILHWVKFLIKGLSEDDKREGLFKRLKNIENAQKYLIKNDDKDDKDKKQQTNNIDTKPPNVFNYLKSLSQEANDLMDDIEEVNNDIDIYKLVFIGSNKEKFNFNTFNMPLNFISDIYNGKISFKKAEFKQRDLEKKSLKNKKKIKMWMRHERLLKKFLITIKKLKKFFIVHQKLIKENQNQRLKKVLQRG